MTSPYIYTLIKRAELRADAVAAGARLSEVDAALAAQPTITRLGDLLQHSRLSLPRLSLVPERKADEQPDGASLDEIFLAANELRRRRGLPPASPMRTHPRVDPSSTQRSTMSGALRAQSSSPARVASPSSPASAPSMLRTTASASKGAAYPSLPMQLRQTSTPASTAPPDADTALIPASPMSEDSRAQTPATSSARPQSSATSARPQSSRESRHSPTRRGASRGTVSLVEDPYAVISYGSLVAIESLDGWFLTVHPVTGTVSVREPEIAWHTRPARVPFGDLHRKTEITPQSVPIWYFRVTNMKDIPLHTSNGRAIHLMQEFWLVPIDGVGRPSVWKRSAERHWRNGCVLAPRVTVAVPTATLPTSLAWEALGGSAVGPPTAIEAERAGLLPPRPAPAAPQPLIDPSSDLFHARASVGIVDPDGTADASHSPATSPKRAIIGHGGGPTAGPTRKGSTSAAPAPLPLSHYFVDPDDGVTPSLGAPATRPSGPHGGLRAASLDACALRSSAREKAGFPSRADRMGGQQAGALGGVASVAAFVPSEAACASGAAFILGPKSSMNQSGQYRTFDVGFDSVYELTESSSLCAAKWYARANKNSGGSAAPADTPLRNFTTAALGNSGMYLVHEPASGGGVVGEGGDGGGGGGWVGVSAEQVIAAISAATPDSALVAPQPSDGATGGNRRAVAMVHDDGLLDRRSIFRFRLVVENKRKRTGDGHAGGAFAAHEDDPHAHGGETGPHSSTAHSAREDAAAGMSNTNVRGAAAEATVIKSAFARRIASLSTGLDAASAALQDTLYNARLTRLGVAATRVVTDDAANKLSIVAPDMGDETAAENLTLILRENRELVERNGDERLKRQVQVPR